MLHLFSIQKKTEETNDPCAPPPSFQDIKILGFIRPPGHSQVIRRRQLRPAGRPLLHQDPHHSAQFFSGRGEPCRLSRPFGALSLYQSFTGAGENHNKSSAPLACSNKKGVALFWYSGGPSRSSTLTKIRKNIDEISLWRIFLLKRKS